jgi:multidrug efflux pump subunit AcrA (membrane-fusion protein)
MKYIFVLVGLVLFFSCQDSQEKILPSKTRLTESVYSSVTVQPDSLYQVYAIVAGIVESNLVEEGEVVQKGTPLIQIINTTPKLNADNARLALRLAQENYNGSSAVLSALEDEIRAATLSCKNDSTNFFRQKNLWEQNIGSKVQLENKKLAYELSRNKLRILQNSYERTKNELATQVLQAQNNYEAAQVSTKDFTVVSKINGKVYALLKEPGESVTTMEPLASVGSASNFIIEMLVDEVDIVRLAEGKKALITLDAYGQKVFEAEISKIYPQKNERSQTFMVEAIFKSPPERLYPGLAGEGNIIVAEKDEVLTIPKAYLIDNNRVLTEDGEKEVVIGLQNLEKVEILDGIDANTYLLKPKG